MMSNDAEHFASITGMIHILKYIKKQKTVILHFNNV